MKSKFEWRCDGFDRMGMAGVHSIGMGVLIGLEKEWRTDVVMMAHHLRYLQKHYWKTKYSVNSVSYTHLDVYKRQVQVAK